MTAMPGTTAAGPVWSRYAARLASGEIESDTAQADAARRLDSLAVGLERSQAGKPGLLSFFRRSGNAAEPMRGLYLHGGVGRGKTMLMDLFFDAVSIRKKRRRHFHEFMAEAHEAIGHARKRTPGDPIPLVASDIADAARLLCFDELHVTDIADAMILGRLFTVLFARGVVVVATSNAQPQDLYRHGLNRQLFLPFIDLIEDHMEVQELAAARDFRLEKLAGRPLYFAPLGPEAKAALDDIWRRLSGIELQAAHRVVLEVKGHTVEVPMAAHGVARFTFDDLCARPLGAADYLRIAREFHTVMLDDIPILDPARRNEARRFINLIDALYDNRVGFIASAAAEPEDLYRSGDGADLFQRTVSRLTEMRTEGYLTARTDRPRLTQQTL